MSTITTPVYHVFKSVEMTSIGPGDADVTTKSGRYTSVLVDIRPPHFEESKHQLKTHVLYRISEEHHDWTTLEMDRDVIIPVPANWRNVQLPEITAFHLETVISGRNHKWNDLWLNSSDNFIIKLSAKIDGKGDDNDGNAGIEISFNIPVEHT
jgi:hypothetical protein